MFRKEYDEFIQKWFPEGMRNRSGITGTVIINALAIHPKPLKSLFFQPRPDPNLIVVIAPLTFTVNAIIFSFLTVGYAVKAFVDLVMQNPSETLKDLKKSMISLLAIFVAVLAAVVSPLLNLIDMVSASIARIHQIKENTLRIRQETIKLEAILHEIRSQNQDIIHGLEHSTDPRYTPSDETPDEYICPITRQIMRQPVEIEPGRFYEATAIQRWYDLGHRSSPMTRLAIRNPSEITINLTFRMRIIEYLWASTTNSQLVVGF